MKDLYLSLGKGTALPQRICDLCKLRLVMVLILCALTAGCLAPKRTYIVPRQCLKINAQSFTRPCMQRSDGKLVCDGVVITATCVQTSSVSGP
jgi:hypothetical protein